MMIQSNSVSNLASKRTVVTTKGFHAVCQENEILTFIATILLEFIERRILKQITLIPYQWKTAM